MCGIVGLLHTDGRPVDRRDILAMREALVHRGPDDAGLFVDGPVGLGHRRLSIIDIVGGHQPMGNPGGTVQIVFNGEIYNYRELQAHLRTKGFALRTRSDTETILGLYELYRDRCVEFLRGMFAFVLWDGRRRRLLCARDRLGIKPLYLFRAGRTIAVASEIKAFFPMQQWTAEIEETHLAEYLVYRDLPAPHTLFRAVESLPAGATVTFEGTDESRRTYWSLPTPCSSAAAERPTEDWIDELDGMLDSVVREHMISDVRLGTFNSGGIDSSLVTAYAAKTANDRLDTHSIAFDEASFDETAFANIVAGRYGTAHHTFTMTEREFSDLLPFAIWQFDEPLNHPNSVPIYALSRLAKERVTVVLTGEGADELFGGYPRYRLPRLLDTTRHVLPVLRPIILMMARLRPERERARIESLLRKPGQIDVQALSTFAASNEVERLLARTTPRADHTFPPFQASPPHVFPTALLGDQRRYLQSLLMRLDKMAMAASLEGRVPFLDHRVVELAATVPPALKVNRGRTKYLLKEVARRYLPATIIDRKKVGLAVPISAWFRTGRALDDYSALLLDSSSALAPYVERSSIRDIVTNHRSSAHDNSELLWGLTNLELWLRIVQQSVRQKTDKMRPRDPATLATADGAR